MAKYLVVVRHGPQSDIGDKGLSENGRVLTQRMAASLSVATQDPGSVSVLSSPLLRAQETAQIIASTYSTGVIIEGKLDIDASDEDLIEVVNTNADSTDTLILVTHLECVSKLLDYLSIFSKVDCPLHSLHRASAMIFNLESRTCTHIQRADMN